MAESLADRLRRIAAEKKAAAAKVAEPVAEVISDDKHGLGEVRTGSGGQQASSTAEESGVIAEASNGATESRESGTLTTSSSSSSDTSNECTVTGSLEPSGETGETYIQPEGLGSGSGEGASINTEVSGEVASSLVSEQPTSTDITELTTSSEHPLAMQFAELEAALLARDPEFKLILRQVHQHLGKDVELVTMMTEEEVALVVGGLVLFANTEIVEPAKAKGVKKAVAAAKKQVISADDL